MSPKLQPEGSKITKDTITECEKPQIVDVGRQLLKRYVSSLLQHFELKVSYCYLNIYYKGCLVKILQWLVFMPPRLKIRGILFLSCLSFCHSVILSFSHSVLLSETLTLLITFEHHVLELWYFTWIFPVIRPSRGYHYFWHCDLNLGVWPIFWKL